MIPFVALGPTIGDSNAIVYVSGPVDTAEKQKLFLYFGDDYAADIEIVLPGWVDYATCTAVMAIEKEDERNVRLEKAAPIFSALGKIFVRFALVQADYEVLKPGRYKYDIEVRTATDEHATKVSSYARIYETIVQ